MQIFQPPIGTHLDVGIDIKLAISMGKDKRTLIPSLSVVDNLLLGDLASRRGWYVSWRRER